MNSQSNLFSLRELIALGIGGMIGGGIFSVLGLAVNISGHGAPFAFLIAGLVALSAGYAYVKLALAFHSDGASFTYLEHAFPKRLNIAGILGWIIVVGYIGTLSLYAYTFGIYAADLLGNGTSENLRSLLSCSILIIFMIINLTGIKETGVSEDLIVYSKIILLTILGCIGFFTIKTEQFFPVFNKGPFSIFSAAAIIFVAYEGFQLITNAVCETNKPKTNIPRAIYSSIIIVTVVYFLLAIMSIGNLTIDQFNMHGEYALAIAVFPSLGKFGHILVDIAALLATSSAINATLFGSARMAAEISLKKMMPKAFSFSNRNHTPWVSITVITLLALIFSFTSNLQVIVTFSSLTFLIVSIGVGIANIKLIKKTKANIWLSLLGLILMTITSVKLIWHLALYEAHTLIYTIIVYLLLVIIELTIGKRRKIWR